MRRRRQKHKRIKWIIALTAAAIAFKCFAQEAAQTFDVLIAAETTVENGGAVAAGLTPLQPETTLDLTDVELTGYFEDKSAVLNGARNTQNGKSVGLPEPYKADIGGAAVLEQNKVLTVEGDKEKLLSLLSLLFNAEPAAGTEQEQIRPFIPPLSERAERDDEETYDSSAIAVNEQQDEVAFTLADCPVRVDWDNNVVVYQSEVVKSVNGQEVERQGCQDSDFPIDILRAYSLCADDVVLADKKAFKMYKPYFLDKGEQKFLKECTRDEEQAFDIKENLDCLPQIDMNGKKVLEQSYLYYTDDTDRAVTVSECQTRDTTRTFDLRFTYDTCSIRVDGEKNVAYQQGKYVYDKDGTTIDVTSCQDGDKTYPVSDEFCYYRDNLAAKKAVRYERKKVNTVNGLHYLTDCQPVSQTDIFETSEECEGLHKDDFTAGFSYGYSRYYYVNDKNARVYLTECAVNATTYPHQAVIEDWQVDFENLNATSLIAYYIDLPSGRVKISDAAVTKDSIAVPLARQSEQIVKTDEYTDAGCWRNYKQELLETYLLPNGKTIENRTSLTETSPVYICRDEEQEGTASYCAYRNCSGFSCILSGRYRTYTATYTRTLSNHKETGASVCSAWTQTAISSQKSKTCDKSRPCGTSYILNGTCVNGQAAPDEQCK